jgi:mannose-6-phosphate isomerase-like protein (cupin superfamily)
MTYPKVLVRSEQSRGRIGVIESVMPPGVTGPPLHKHDFDEAFYVLEGRAHVSTGRRADHGGRGRACVRARR